MSITIHPLKVHRYLMKNYCYLIIEDCTRKAVVIDPAWQIESIDQALRENNASLSAIFLTHSHFDHVNLASLLVKKYNPLVLMSKIEIDYYHFHCLNLFPIEEHASFLIGDCQVLPILTPGHTKGSLCYLIKGNLFTGDTLFTEGCGICWGEGADPYAMFDSLRILKQNLPLDTRIYPGHSYGEIPGRSFDYLLKNNIYLNFQQCHEFVSFRMRNNQRDIFEFK